MDGEFSRRHEYIDTRSTGPEMLGENVSLEGREKMTRGFREEERTLNASSVVKRTPAGHNKHM